MWHEFEILESPTLTTPSLNIVKKCKEITGWHASCFIDRLWGTVNILYCHRCGNYFQCTELGHCSYHPMTVDYGNMECTATKIVGVYPCCQQRVLHFDPSLETSVSLTVVLQSVETSFGVLANSVRSCLWLDNENRNSISYAAGENIKSRATRLLAQIRRGQIRDHCGASR